MYHASLTRPSLVRYLATATFAATHASTRVKAKATPTISQVSVACRPAINQTKCAQDRRSPKIHHINPSQTQTRLSTIHQKHQHPHATHLTLFVRCTSPRQPYTQASPTERCDGVMQYQTRYSLHAHVASIIPAFRRRYAASRAADATLDLDLRCCALVRRLWRAGGVKGGLW